MPDVRVERGSTARLERVEGRLTASNNARIVAARGNLVTVTGPAHFEGSAEIACDLECDSLTVDRGRLTVTGDLRVRNAMDVAHSVDSSGSIAAGQIDVGGKLSSKSIACERSIVVGGVITVAESLEADSVEVGGKAEIRGAIKVKDMGVGGKAEVGRGSISGKVRVGGIFECYGPLEFGELQAYGRCDLPAGSKGKKISTFGKLSVAGGLSCSEVSVEGHTEVDGDCVADRVSVNGRFNTRGSLTVKERLEANGSVDVLNEIRASELLVGGRLRAKNAVIANGADIAGELETRDGLKAASITIRGGSRCKGPLVGGRVELGKSALVLANWGAHWGGQSIMMRGVGRMTQAEDIYGDEVILGRATRCRRIFAKTVEIAEGCTVEEVNYTEELRYDGTHTFFTRPPQRVSTLPRFPL